MEGWHGCGSGGDSYDPGRISELAPRRGGARRARPLLRRATLGGRDARRAPVRERRRAAGDSGAGVVGPGACRLARGVRRASPHRRPAKGRDGLGAARAGRSGRRGRGDADRAGAGEPHVPAAVRARVPDLCHGQERRRDARRAARSPHERSDHGAPHRGGRAGQDHAAPTPQTGGLMSGITTHILDIARGRPAAGVAVSLARRWAHVITGVAWIGTSFYFNWLNSRLAPPPPERREPGVAGELWSVHGGGFYRVVKYTVAPGELPRTLHWFKWEAYATWLTGFALLVLVYYLGAASFLVDPQGARLSPGGGVAVGVATLIVSWLVYDALCRSPLGVRPSALGATLFVLATALAWGLAQLLSPRAAYLHVGAEIGRA